MKDLYRNRDPEQARAVGSHIRDQAAALGLEYGRRTRLDNSRLAQELGLWADTQANGEAFHDAMYRAYFVDDRNIGDPATLIEIVGSVGLDQQAARQVLDQRAFSEQVTQAWERAWNSGITGVPTFFSRDLFVFGCQPYEVLERFYNHLVKLRLQDSEN